MPPSGNEDTHPSKDVPRKTYFRSISWTGGARTPDQSNRSKPHFNSKARSALPPLQPLSVTRKSVKEWPQAGSDDLGVWHPPTPSGDRIQSRNNLNQVSDATPAVSFEFQKDKLAYFDKECSRITNHIYLGSDAVARNREVLRQNGITHVLNCVGFVCPEYFKNDIIYKTLWLQDSPCEDITSILYDVFDYIEEVREKDGRVLVHCCQGVSRSTSLVIAYLMWREELSFEDAFQLVKKARGVANPNMGFACQLLQCQKRVHAVPASPNSMLKMYRMAPHSPHDPLHLVPKMLVQPSEKGLDSRGAFVVHVPSGIYVWTGKYCRSVMSNSATRAALQLVRYERAQGSVISVTEGKEPSEFWGVISGEVMMKEEQGEENVEVKEVSNNTNRISSSTVRVGNEKVDDYDMDFEIFEKALAGGVIPLLPFSTAPGSETRLPARENGWDRLRRKFASGIMKKFLLSSTNCDTVDHFDHCGSEKPSFMDKKHPAPADSNVPESYLEPKSPSHDFSCENDCLSNSSSPSSPTPTGSPDSSSCNLDISPKIFSSKSPSPSPSASDYSSSSVSFSPSTSNSSDSSTVSSYPSPTMNLDNLHKKKPPFFLTDTETPLQLATGSPEAFSPENYMNISTRIFSSLLCKEGTTALPSIAERRGSQPPSPVLPQLDRQTRHGQKRRVLVRSCSFSLPDLGDDDDDDDDDDCYHDEMVLSDCSCTNYGDSVSVDNTDANDEVVLGVVSVSLKDDGLNHASDEYNEHSSRDDHSQLPRTDVFPP